MHDEPSSSGTGCGCCGGCLSTLISLLIAVIGGLIVLFTQFGPDLKRQLGPWLDSPDPVEQPARERPEPRPKRGKGGKRRR